MSLGKSYYESRTCNHLNFEFIALSGCIFTSVSADPSAPSQFCDIPTNAESQLPIGCDETGHMHFVPAI